MPCDAIATARAKISQDLTLKQCAALLAYALDADPATVSTEENEFSIYVTSGVARVRYNKASRQVQITSYTGNNATTERIKQAFERGSQLLAATSIAGRGKVVISKKASNGSIVMKVKV